MSDGTICPLPSWGSTVVNVPPVHIASETSSISGVGFTVMVINLGLPSQSAVEGVTSKITCPVILFELLIGCTVKFPVFVDESYPDK